MTRAVSSLGMLWLAAGLATSTPVGMSGEVRGVFLPGSLLRPKPDAAGRAPMTVRVIDVYPHGDAGFRYNLAYTGYAAGKYSLCDWMERVDGTPLGVMPPVRVEVEAAVPAGPPTKLPDVPAELPRVGGYRILLVVGGVLWVAGFIALLVWRRKRPPATETAAEPEVTLPERLRTLLLAAREGTLTPDQRATLDRLVLGYWRQRLGLTHIGVREAISAIKSHEEAGLLLRRVEEWLHRPSAATDRPDAEVASLLEPYLARDALAGEKERAKEEVVG